MKFFIIIGLFFAILIVVFIIQRKPKLVDKSLATYVGKPEDYHGEKKLIVAFTAAWTGVWKLTEGELKKLDYSRYDLCILDTSVERSEIQRYKIDFFPTVALFENGTITKRVQNMTSIDQIKDW
jgi:hypothetical protein